MYIYENAMISNWLSFNREIQIDNRSINKHSNAGKNVIEQVMIYQSSINGKSIHRRGYISGDF